MFVETAVVGSVVLESVAVEFVFVFVGYESASVEVVVAGFVADESVVVDSVRAESVIVAHSVA